MENFDRVEFCRQKFHELFGGEPAGNEGTDPEFMRILQRYIFGEVCAVGSLDNRVRELITVTILSVYQTLFRRMIGESCGLTSRQTMLPALAIQIR